MTAMQMPSSTFSLFDDEPEVYIVSSPITVNYLQYRPEAKQAKEEPEPEPEPEEDLPDTFEIVLFRCE